MSFDLAVVLGFLLASAGLMLLLMFVGKLLRIVKYGSDHLSTYECGEKPLGSAWFNFNNRFYVIALVFVAFDVQVALAVPLIVVLRKLLGEPSAAVTFTAVFAYLGLMMLTLAYVWRHGDLSWVRDLKAGQQLQPTRLPIAGVKTFVTPSSSSAHPAEGRV